MEGHRAGCPIAPTDQRPCVVAEDRPRDAAEVGERRGDPLPPVILPLIEEGFDKQPARVAQDRDEEEHSDRALANLHALLAEVDLQLIPGRRLHTHRRQGSRPTRLADVRHGSLDRPYTDVDPALPQETLHDDGVALRGSFIQRPRLCARMLRQPPSMRPRLTPGRDRPPQIASHRIARDSDRPRDCLTAHTTTRQLPNRGNQLALEHRYLLCRRYQYPLLQPHRDLLLVGQF